MDEISLNLLYHSDIETKDFFENAIVIFDSSALLDLYNYPIYTRFALFDEVFSKIEGRLWIPSQVEFEYLKNREKTIKKPIEVYKNLIDKSSNNKEGGYITQIGKELKNIKEQNRKNISGNIQALKQITKNADKHPHIEHKKVRSFDKILVNFDRKIEEIEKNYESFCAEMNIAIQEQIDKVNRSINDDDVFKYISKNFKVGPKSRFDELVQLCQVGKLRYELQIPPGYADEAEKVGMQKYGDFILWNQIIEFAASINRKVIFVTNDSKSDWWEYEGKRNTERPRIELLKEFSDKADNEVYITNSNKFYFEAKQYLKLSIDQDILDTIVENSHISIAEEQIEAEMLFFDWLSSKSKFRNIQIEVNIGDKPADIIGQDVDDVLLVFEIKTLSFFNKTIVDEYLRHFLEQCRQFSKETEAKKKFFLSIVLKNEQQAIKASKYLDMYVVEANKRYSNNHVKYHVIIGYIDYGKYELIYSDYNLIPK